jgi:hypothetical protein
MGRYKMRATQDRGPGYYQTIVLFLQEVSYCACHPYLSSVCMYTMRTLYVLIERHAVDRGGAR